MLHSCLKLLFSEYTLRLIYCDLICRVRWLNLIFQRNVIPAHRKLHLGCGNRKIKGWLNSDVRNSDYDVDYTQKLLPWKAGSFDAIISQHVIEHLELTKELIPLLKELRRILRPQGEIWLSCPDLEKICTSYLNNKMLDLLEDRRKRFPSYSMGEIPSQYMINDFFHQYAYSEPAYGFRPLDWKEGAHKNLYDFELLEWALTKAQFTNVERISEKDLLVDFPEFPPRGDDLQSIYVKAIAG